MRRHYLTILALLACAPLAGAQAPPPTLIARVEQPGEAIIIDKETGKQSKLLFSKTDCPSEDGYWSPDGLLVVACNAMATYRAMGSPIDFSKAGETYLMLDPNAKPGPGTDDPGPSKAPGTDNNG